MPSEDKYTQIDIGGAAARDPIVVMAAMPARAKEMENACSK
jgi:hypothetical protein